jgi:hypothetical protein
MFTSNFANVKRLPHHLAPIGIAVKPPVWWHGRNEPRLAPTLPMLRMEPAEYDKHFAAILAALDPEQLYAELGDNAVLLCWEKPGKRCHRRMVAEWFETYLGVEVPEYGCGNQRFLFPT